MPGSDQVAKGRGARSVPLPPPSNRGVGTTSRWGKKGVGENSVGVWSFFLSYRVLRVCGWNGDRLVTSLMGELSGAKKLATVTPSAVPPYTCGGGYSSLGGSLELHCIGAHGSGAITFFDGGVRVAIVDYFAGTVKNKPVEEVLHYVGRYAGSFVESSGAHGYAKCYASDGFRVYHSGAAGMGVYVQVSGQGCALLAAHERFDTWGDFCRSWQAFGGSATRIDLAFDDRSALLDIHKIAEYAEAGNYSSKYRTVNLQQYKHEGAETGRLVYFGTIQSDTSLCFYDKRLERLSKGESDPGHWVRVEYRAKGKAAESVLSWLVGHPDLEGASGYLASAIEFREPSQDENKSRWPLCSWWEDFRTDSEKIRLNVPVGVKSVVEQAVRFAKQHAPTLCMLTLIFCHGAPKGDWLTNLVMHGWGRMSHVQTNQVVQALGHRVTQMPLLPFWTEKPT